MANAPVNTIETPGLFSARAANPKGAGVFVRNEARDGSIPYIDALNPVSGLAKRGSVYFELVDETTIFAAIVIGVSFDGGDIPDEFVYVAAGLIAGFATHYAASSVADLSATRKAFTIRRLGVWPSAPRFLPIAVDPSGNVNA